MAVDWLIWFGCVLAGGGVGLFYFGGLWATVRMLPSVQRPVLWSLSSFVVRTALSLWVFYLLLDAGWTKVLAALVSFTAVRFVLIRRWGPEGS